jgi:ubiquinone/menaquinone biosynthesis C-methylase UbiE
MGKPVIHLSVREGYRLWAPTYDSAPNPLLALEERIVIPILGRLAGLRVIDLCSGTGRWMARASSICGSVVGIDLSPEMLACAIRKPGCGGRAVVADLCRLPLRNNSADLAICSFGISYVPSLPAAIREIARVARRVVISDLHPTAAQAGWSRSFPTAEHNCCIDHYSRTLEQLDEAADAAGLDPEQSVAAHFGEPERSIFASAGKACVFDEVSRIPAIFVKTWTRRC